MLAPVYMIKKNQSGYALIFALVALSSFVAMMVLYFANADTLLIKKNKNLIQAKQANALAVACSEVALQEIRNSTPYSGSGNLSLVTGTCNYTVTNTGGSNRTIEAYGTVNNVVRRVSIFIDAINPNINIISWQEVNSF